MAEHQHAGGEEPGSIRVLAAVVERDDCWLLCLRPRSKRHGGCWEFPGGKLHAGESLLDAARRELGEELGVQVHAVGDVIFVGRDVGSPFIIEFAVAEIRGEPMAMEHDDIRWVPRTEAADLPLAPADRAFVEYCAPGRGS
jgi:8-oxo-dGTP pyrophosphatase MutT (NUDIX family)